MNLRWLVFFAASAAALAQSGKVAEPGRPGLFLREDFKETPPVTPITQEHIVNPKLVLGMYGPGKDGLRKSHHDTPADDPYYLWDGSCEGTCVATLRDKVAFVDLRGQAKIRWRTKQSGFHRLHLVVKLAGGSWLVSDAVEGPSNDWRETEVALPDLSWRQLDIGKVVEGKPVEHPDLSRVDEVGWSTLMPGGSTPASSRVDWIEVYGRAVPRDTATKR